MDTLISYMNISEDNAVEDVADFIKSSTLNNSLEYLVRGKPATFQVRGAESKIYCFSEDDEDLLNPKMRKIFNEVYSLGESPYVSPGSPEFDSAINSIIDHRDMVRNFILSCHENERLDLKFLDDCLNNAQKKGDFKLKPNGWTPIIYIRLNTEGIFDKTIQDYVEQEFILSPLFQGKAEEWKKIVRCAECNKFFLAERTTAKFCSNVCRMRFNRRK